MAKGATTMFALTSAGTVLTSSRTFGLGTFTGIQVRGGHAELHQTVFEQSRGTAVFATGADSSIELHDTVLRQDGPIQGGGIDVRDRAQLAMHRTTMLDAGNFATVFSEGAEITGEDLLVYRQMSNASLVRGIGATNSANVTLRRVKIVRPGYNGVYAFGTDARLTLTDATIIEVRSDLVTGNGSPGVVGEENGLVILERVVVDRARGTGLLVIEQGRVEGSDIVVKNTGPRERGNAYGRGLEITGAGTIEVDRIQFTDNLSAGVFVSDNNSLAVLRDVEISGTSQSECIEFSCQATLADGVSSLLEGQVFLTRAWVHDNDQYGLRSQGANNLFVDGGLIEGNAIGVQISDPEFDLTDINLRTIYRNNGTTLIDLAE